MIYDHQGVPIREVLTKAALAVGERKRHRAPVHYEQDVEGNRLYRILHTRLGDAYRVFRQVMRSTSSAPYNKTQENARRTPGLKAEYLIPHETLTAKQILERFGDPNASNP